MGIQINGNNDIISALDGSWTAEGASINTSGILTATTFKGNVTGTACTFVDGNFTGNVTIGGTLTYEDVTNIDSVGVITARGGITLGGGNINLLDRPDGSNHNLFFGTGAKAAAYHDGTNFTLINNTGHTYIGIGAANKNLMLYAQSTGNIILQRNTGHKYFEGVGSDGTAIIYYNTNEKIRTTNTGAVVTGILTATTFSGAVTTTDSCQVGDLTILNGNPDLRLKDSNHGGNNTEHMIAFQDSSGNNQMNIGSPFGEQHLRIKHGTTELVKIQTDGRVGLGEVSPGRHLHIKQPGQIKLESTDTGNWLGIEFLGSSGTNNYDAYMGLLDSNGLFFIDNNSNGNDFMIAQNGKVYIGADATEFSDAGTFLNLRNNTFGGRIGFSNNTATAGVALMEQFAYWGSNKVAGMIISAGTDTTNKDDANMSFYTAPAGTLAERLKIQANGRITIGEANFTASNDVHIKRANAGGDVALRITNNTNQNSGSTASLYFTTSPTQDFNTAYIQAKRLGGRLEFGYATNRATVVMHNDNKVGIARTINSYQLDTSGTPSDTGCDTEYDLSINRECMNSTNAAFLGFNKTLNVDNQYTVSTFRSTNTNRNSTSGWMDIAKFVAWDIDAKVIIQAGGTFTGDQVEVRVMSSYNSALNNGRSGPHLEVTSTQAHTGDRFTKVRIGCDNNNRHPILQVYFDGSKTHNALGTINVTCHDYGSNYGGYADRGEARFQSGTTLNETWRELLIVDATSVGIIGHSISDKNNILLDTDQYAVRVNPPPSQGGSTVLHRQALIGTKHIYTAYHSFSSTNSNMNINSIRTNSCGELWVIGGWANGNGLRMKKYTWVASGDTAITEQSNTFASRYGVGITINTPTMSISGDYVHFNFTFSDNQGSKMEKLKIHFEYFHQFLVDS